MSNVRCRTCGKWIPLKEAWWTWLGEGHLCKPCLDSMNREQARSLAIGMCVLLAILALAWFVAEALL